MSEASWIRAIDPELVERRFGADAVTAALARSRVYASGPSVDGSKLVASIVDAPGERRLGSPMRVAARMREADMLDVSCACKKGRICDHVVWLFVDVAYHPALREALVAGQPAEALAKELPRLRASALEARTLDDRLAAWLPAPRFDDGFEIDVDVITLQSPPSWTGAAREEGRAAVLLRHRRPPSRALVPARDVLAARLPPKHRRLVELTAPFHLDRDALVATRGQASILVHLLRDAIGIRAGDFKGYVRFGRSPVSPRVERDGSRLVARWYDADGERVGDAGETFLLAGPFPYLWSPATLTFHEVAPSVDLDAAMGLHRVPSLPFEEGSRERVGRALLGRGRRLGVALPPPEDFGLPPLEKPSFELRLEGTPLEVRATLAAVYTAGKIPLESAPPSDGSDVRTCEGRDVDEEDAALALVRAAGFRSEDEALVARDDDAVGFWKEGLAKLRASESPRFEVLVTDALARTRIGPPAAVDVRVTASAGWLDVELEFRAGALTVEIARMHAALAEGRRWVVLSDGSLSKITSELALLLGEIAPGRALEERMRLPPHQLGRVARWIELAERGSPSAEPASRVTLDARARALRERLRDLAARPEPRLPSGLQATLRPYQRAGLAWLQLLRELGAGGLLADDMGLGKTLMTLAFLARWKEEEGTGAPALVVCPTSLVGNWLREAARFTPDLGVAAWTGTSRASEALERHDLVVTTYGLLRREVDRLVRTRFRAVVLDEAQNVKNPAAETSRAARALDAEMRIALTGTPVENRLGELWSLMTFANPGMLGTLRDFEERWARPIATRPDSELAAELRAVVRPFILRRTKAEVLLDLPPKTEVERPCVLGVRQRRLYDALALALRKAVARDLRRRDGARARLSALTAILRLRQMACDPRLVDPDVPAWDSAKRAVFLDLVRELVAEERRALVFSQFVELLALWRQDLDAAKVPYEYLDGTTKDRDAVVERFQSGSAPLFLVSLKAGGAGLNLTAADTVIHCDPWWNPAAEDQATDRAHRIGQTRPVTVVRLVARGTIEDKIALLKQHKRELVDAVIGHDAGALGGLTDEDIHTLLGDVEGEVDADVDGHVGERSS